MMITPQELNAMLGEVVVLDASSHMPATGRDANAEFIAAHIPGARRFDIDVIADTTSGLPHTLPSPEFFAEKVGALGVSNASTVVVYEVPGTTFAAPRGWWMFRVMGHDNVKVLKGGLEGWIAAGLPTEAGAPAAPEPATFVSHYRPDRFASGDDVQKALEGGNVADARAAERFEGRVEEPRPGLRSGHMPGAKNVPFPDLLGPDGQLKDDASLRAAFSEAGVDLSQPVITSCGSGVTAAILTMALEQIGTPSAVYDGSWTEWGGDPNREVVKGPAEG